MHLVSRGDVDEAGAIIHWKRRRPVRAAVIPPMTQYSALLVRRRPTEAEVHRRRAPLEALLTGIGHHYRTVQLLSDVADPRPAQWLGWRVSPLFTYCLDLRAASPRWSESTRRSYRRHRQDFQVTESADHAQAIIRLCSDSYARHGRRLPAHPALLLRLMARLGNRVRCFAATPAVGGPPAAGLAVLHDGRTAHYWVAGSAPGPSMTVLIGRVLSQLAASNIRTFDFVGANTASIAEFKRHFGPVLTQYYALTRGR